MSNQFREQDLRDTIERCRRLARSTHDAGMASKLLAMADEMEKALNRALEQYDGPIVSS